MGDSQCGFFADIDQGVGFGRRGELVPTMTSHGTVVRLPEQRIMTGMERLFAHGYPVYLNRPEYANDLVQSVANKGLSHNDIAFISGMGMHLPSVAAWMLFVFAHCTPKVFFASLTNTVYLNIAGCFADLSQGPDVPKVTSLSR